MFLTREEIAEALEMTTEEWFAFQDKKRAEETDIANSRFSGSLDEFVILKEQAPPG